MAVDPRNNGNLTGGIVAEPEVRDMKGGKIVKFRIGVDRAGTEKNSDNTSGYFNVTFYARDGDPHAEWVLRQVAESNFTKGTLVQLLYRLNQERWTADDDKRQDRVVLVAESIGYAGRKSAGGSDKAAEGDDSVELPTRF